MSILVGDSMCLILDNDPLLARRQPTRIQSVNGSCGSYVLLAPLNENLLIIRDHVSDFSGLEILKAFS